jgi:protein-S-isoprenylcysteine O-methyltransferase Ste14
MKNKVPPPLILLLFGAAMWFVAHSEWAYATAMPYALAIAIASVTVGFAIIGTAIRQFGAAETTVNPLKPEEVALRKLFAEDYERYCEKVGRWF